MEGCVVLEEIDYLVQNLLQVPCIVDCCFYPIGHLAGVEVLKKDSVAPIPVQCCKLSVELLHLLALDFFLAVEGHGLPFSIKQYGETVHLHRYDELSLPKPA